MVVSVQEKRRKERELYRRRMTDPEYAARQAAKQRDWYARRKAANPDFSARQTASAQRWRRENFLRARFNTKRSHARREGKFAWDLAFEDIDWPTHCPVLGMALRYEPGEAGGRTWDDSPSFDRVDNSKGYVRGNVIVVSHLANRIKYTATPEQIRRVAEFYERLIRGREDG